MTHLIQYNTIFLKIKDEEEYHIILLMYHGYKSA